MLKNFSILSPSSVKSKPDKGPNSTFLGSLSAITGSLYFGEDPPEPQLIKSYKE
jgi:hypothetical protein